MSTVSAKHPIPAYSAAKHVALTFGNVRYDMHIWLEFGNITVMNGLTLFRKVGGS